MPDINLLTSPSVHAPVVNPLEDIKKNQNKRQIKGWDIKASPLNPLRALLAEIGSTPLSTEKEILNLGLGDPTGLHLPPPASVSAVKEVLERGQDNGYIPGPGTLRAREAIADYHRRWDGVSYAKEDVVLTHGVGHALDTIFHILIPPSPAIANILLPKPGFAQYAMLLGSLGCEIRYYHLREDKGWEVDLEELEGLVDENTKGIMITNPSNPCGSNYSKSHLSDILDIADRHKVPIIADEIYGHMTWDTSFHPLAALSTTVPIITLSGLSKRFLLPGWRIGWIALHDPLGVASEVRQGMVTWSNRFMGPSSVVQAALPRILETSKEWFDEVMDLVKINARIVTDRIARIPRLSCTTPQGSLYILLKLDSSLSIPKDAEGRIDDMAFSKALYKDQAVFLMPGSQFDAPGYIRLVIASKENVMREVMDRLEEFCAAKGGL